MCVGAYEFSMQMFSQFSQFVIPSSPPTLPTSTSSLPSLSRFLIYNTLYYSSSCVGLSLLANDFLLFIFDNYI